MNEKISSTTPSVAAAVLTPEEFVEHLRTMRVQVPSYTQLTLDETLSIVNVARLDPRLIVAAINTASVSTHLESAIGKSAGQLRQESDENTRWTAVEDELRATLQGVIAANRLRRHGLGLNALQIYQISRQLVRQAEHAGLLPYIAEMKRLIRQGRKPAAKTDSEVPAPTPAPKPAPTPKPVE